MIINIDVPDLAQGLRFYVAAFGLRVGRSNGGFVELLGANAPIYLLAKPSGTHAAAAAGDVRRYERHWSPIHLDFAVGDLEAAIERACLAGAVQEGATRDEPYGRLAMFADPFGHGFCLIEFNLAGYDAIGSSN